LAMTQRCTEEIEECTRRDAFGTCVQTVTVCEEWVNECQDGATQNLCVRFENQDIPDECLMMELRCPVVVRPQFECVIYNEKIRQAIDDLNRRMGMLDELRQFLAPMENSAFCNLFAETTVDTAYHATCQYKASTIDGIPDHFDFLEPIRLRDTRANIHLRNAIAADTIIFETKVSIYGDWTRRDGESDRVMIRSFIPLDAENYEDGYDLGVISAITINHRLNFNGAEESAPQVFDAIIQMVCVENRITTEESVRMQVLMRELGLLDGNYTLCPEFTPIELPDIVAQESTAEDQQSIFEPDLYHDTQYSSQSVANPNGEIPTLVEVFGHDDKRVGISALDEEFSRKRSYEADREAALSERLNSAVARSGDISLTADELQERQEREDEQADEQAERAAEQAREEQEAQEAEAEDNDVEEVETEVVTVQSASGEITQVETSPEELEEIEDQIEEIRDTQDDRRHRLEERMEERQERMEQEREEQEENDEREAELQQEQAAEELTPIIELPPSSPSSEEQAPVLSDQDVESNLSTEAPLEITESEVAEENSEEESEELIEQVEESNEQQSSEARQEEQEQQEREEAVAANESELNELSASLDLDQLEDEQNQEIVSDQTLEEQDLQQPEQAPEEIEPLPQESEVIEEEQPQEVSVQNEQDQELAQEFEQIQEQVNEIIEEDEEESMEIDEERQEEIEEEIEDVRESNAAQNEAHREHEAMHQDREEVVEDNQDSLGRLRRRFDFDDEPQEQESQAEAPQEETIDNSEETVASRNESMLARERARRQGGATTQQVESRLQQSRQSYAGVSSADNSAGNSTAPGVNHAPEKGFVRASLVN
jgi:hypothetical protein